MKFRYKTKLGKWYYSLDAECKLVFFAFINLALVGLLCAWDAWLR